MKHAKAWPMHPVAKISASPQGPGKQGPGPPLQPLTSPTSAAQATAPSTYKPANLQTQHRPVVVDAPKYGPLELALSTPTHNSPLMDALDPPRSPTSSRMARRWARKIERTCCTALTYFPLFFVYSVTSWAAIVLVSLSSEPDKVPGWGELTVFPPRLLWIPSRLALLTSPFGRPIPRLLRHPLVPSAQLVLHDSSLHPPWKHHQRQWLQYPSHPSRPRGHFVHCQVQRRASFLQKVPGAQA